MEEETFHGEPSDGRDHFFKPCGYRRELQSGDSG